MSNMRASNRRSRAVYSRVGQSWRKYNNQATVDPLKLSVPDSAAYLRECSLEEAGLPLPIA